jgi:Carboxypeptidase regulatory-like domain
MRSLPEARSNSITQCYDSIFCNNHPPCRALVFLLLLCSITVLPALADGQSISGKVTDPQGSAVANVAMNLVGEDGKLFQQKTTNMDGQFTFQNIPPGKYALKLIVAGFDPVNQPLVVRDAEPLTVNLQLKLAAAKQEVRVSTDVLDVNVASPDPAQRLLIRQETLDANPGRPGAPVSIPGVPIESASGGIKAPQYFAPGVAGDHGEPIASYLQVGSYLVSNNLSANAHGNGYADPNILVPQVIESVQVDGGAFNVREGNHSQNLSATYGLRSRLDPFVTVTGDYRDLDLVSGWSPEGTGKRSWIVVQASYGNGFLDRLEHRQQYKFNGVREFQFGQHDLTLFAVGYYGFSHVPGLVPIGIPDLHDTIDPHQKDQTHTGLLALNDVWHFTGSQQLQLSAFFRTYNLSLFSNFGDGLIRQSEFRTVTGSNATYTNKIGDFLSLLAGVDFQRDAPRRDDLDHYASTDPVIYGPFDKVAANNITIGDLSPYLALEGALARYFRYYFGWRRDEIAINNDDFLVPAHSFQTWAGVNNPKATVSFLPKDHSWLPIVSLSAGEAFFTDDPRIGTGTTQGTLVSRSHSYQLVASKTLAATEFRLTLAHTTTEASLAKIDPDTGLQFNEGPGRLRYMTLAARHYFGFGMLQASYSQADARDLSDGTPTPEAPRLIVDALATFDRLPFHLRARSEFEYIGAKPLGDGFTGVPNTEVRGALLRSFRQGRMDLGVNFLIARGYTGQTTEVLALPDDTAPFERIVGVRLPSYASVSYTYRFQPRPSQ